jgi:hypothetical protein
MLGTLLTVSNPAALPAPDGPRPLRVYQILPVNSGRIFCLVRQLDRTVPCGGTGDALDTLPSCLICWLMAAGDKSSSAASKTQHILAAASKAWKRF